jgi:hypothetical protein
LKKTLDKPPGLCYIIITKEKRKEIKKMKQIDLSKASAHVLIDRKTRVEIIEKTVGFGTPFVEASDIKQRDCTAILTTTGVIVIMDENGEIITTWIASVKQAVSVYARATGTAKLPKWIWNIVNYNNNTEMWQKMVA